uniref:H15 domain-containing protein n=2 Tax=Phytophthora ramorum TaxID=164328 RepID=H3H5I1_PHYRM
MKNLPVAGRKELDADGSDPLFTALQHLPPALMAPTEDTKAAEPAPAPVSANEEAVAPTRSPSSRKAKTAAAAKKDEPKAKAPKEAPKAKKPKAKAAKAKSSTETGPSYFDLVVDAIRELKERNGSSRQAIAKVVEPKKDNYASHHLNKALRTGVEAGKLLQTKGSYKLSPELRKPAATKKKSLKVSEKSAKTVKKVATAKKTATAKKVAAKKAPVKKTAAKKAPVKKTAKKSAPAKKAAPKKAPAKKSTAKKASPKTKKTVKKTAKK